MRKITLSFCLLLTIPAITFARGWRGIVPLHSTCADVKRLLGVTTCDSSAFRLNDETVTIIFSEKPCLDGWNVPPGTVMTIDVHPKPGLKLIDLQIDERNYKRVADEHVRGIVYYSNNQEGVSITVFPDGTVGSFLYGPAAEDNYLRYPKSLAEQPTTSGDAHSIRKFDEYGKLGSAEERKRLDNFAIQLHYTQNDPVNFIDPTGLLPGLWDPYHGADMGWGDVFAGFWGWGDLNNRPRHTGRDIIKAAGSGDVRYWWAWIQIGDRTYGWFIRGTTSFEQDPIPQPPPDPRKDARNNRQYPLDIAHAVIAALYTLEHECYDEQAAKAGSPGSDIQPYNYQFAKINNPDRYVSNWQGAVSSHGGEGSRESPIIPHTSLAVKYYPAGNGDPSLIAVTSPTASLRHLNDYAQFRDGMPVNHRYAEELMKQLPKCPSE